MESPRARTEADKREVIERLFEVWKKAPLLRLGQLLCNSADKGHRLFYMEDEILVKAVEHYIRMPAPDPSKSSPGMF
jgi:hypothetical protein